MLEALEQAALRTLLLAAVVQLALWLLRIDRPQLRLVAWTVVLAASLAMPALQWATPLRLPMLPHLPGSAALMGAATPQRQASASQPSPASAEDDTEPTGVTPWLQALYLLVGAILLLRLTVGVALSLRLLRRATPVHPDWAAGTPIRISPEVVAPVTVAHVIILPPDGMTWPAPMRDAVLAHERAHLARRDFAMLLAAQVNRAVFWFSPLSWWLHRRLAALAELASDDQAMATTRDRPGYAEVLLEMGRRSGPMLRGLAMARPATLKHRIERILADPVTANPASPVHQAALAGCAAILSVAAAGSRPGPAPPLQVAQLTNQSPTPASTNPGSPPPVAEATPQPTPSPPHQTASATQEPPQPTPPAPAAPLSPPAARAPPAARQAPRATPPPRITAQRLRARGQGAQDVPLETVALTSAPRGNDDHAVTSGGGGPAGADIQAGQPPASEPPLVKRTDEPSCTGVYLPKPGVSRTNASPNFVQARYFQEADGTPWLKLFLGQRTRARLTGLEVERNSIQTTVLTTLPRGIGHLTGTTQGTYGTIDFECAGPNAPL